MGLFRPTYRRSLKLMYWRMDTPPKSVLTGNAETQLAQFGIEAERFVLRREDKDYEIVLVTPELEKECLTYI